MAKDRNQYLASEAVSRYGKSAVLSRESQVGIVSLYYPDGIRRRNKDTEKVDRVAASELPEEQLYNIATRLYHQASQVYGEFKRAQEARRKADDERAIAETISRLERATDAYEIRTLDERACIQLEGCRIPFGHDLDKRYNGAKKKAYERIPLKQGVLFDTHPRPN